MLAFMGVMDCVDGLEVFPPWREIKSGFDVEMGMDGRLENGGGKVLVVVRVWWVCVVVEDEVVRGIRVTTS